MPKQRSRLRNRLEFEAYRVARALARLLPPRALAGLGTVLGTVYFAVDRPRRRVLERNLELAMPELDAAARHRLGVACARHFARIALDALRLHGATPEDLLAETEVVGAENLHAALADGRGAFVLSAHLGSWEVAGLIAGLEAPKGLAFVNRPLDNPLLDRELDRLRSLFGNRSLGKKRVTRDLLTTLQKGGVIGILIDQRALPRMAIQVPFFGRPAPTHPILARFMLKTGAPVVPLWGLWEGPARYTVYFGPPIRAEDVPEQERNDVGLTAHLLAVTEAAIRERPEQWLWFHDRWRYRDYPPDSPAWGGPT